MGLDTRLRAKTKKEYEAGASIYEIIHPNTKATNPSTSMPDSNLLKAQMLEGNFTNLKSTRGYTSTVINQINYDLDYAERVYLAFGIDDKSETATAQLEAELTSYEASTENRDDTELEQDITKDTINVLKRNNVSAEEIQACFVRTSTIKGIITLELLAVYLGIEFTALILDLALAVLIKAKIDII